MFYFGGMTLGYLTPPAHEAGAKNGAIVASERRCGPERDDERLPDGRSLLARAKWFGLYW